MLDTRGEILYRERARQINNFAGLRFGKITPTDIDGLIEFQDKAYIFIETKTEGAPFPYGQRLALERLCDDLQKVKPTLIVVGQHNTPVDDDIDVSQAKAIMYRFEGEWRTAYEHTVLEIITRFLRTKCGYTG